MAIKYLQTSKSLCIWASNKPFYELLCSNPYFKEVSQFIKDNASELLECPKNLTNLALAKAYPKVLTIDESLSLRLVSYPSMSNLSESLLLKVVELCREGYPIEPLINFRLRAAWSRLSDTEIDLITKAIGDEAAITTTGELLGYAISSRDDLDIHQDDNFLELETGRPYINNNSKLIRLFFERCEAFKRCEAFRNMIPESYCYVSVIRPECLSNLFQDSVQATEMYLIKRLSEKEPLKKQTIVKLLRSATDPTHLSPKDLLSD